MFIFFRGMLIAGLLACALIALLAGTVHSQGWNAPISAGMTSVESELDAGAYTWTLRNDSSLPGDAYPEFDLLVWELVPYQVCEPLAWTAPEGWIWDGSRMKLADKSRKYYTPYAIAPGSSLTFTYMPDPSGELVNARGPQPESLGFVVRVGAVLPGSGALDGSRRWVPLSVDGFGYTWHDRPSLVPRSDQKPVAEPRGILVMAFGVCSLASFLVPGWRRRHDTDAAPGRD